MRGTIEGPTARALAGAAALGALTLLSLLAPGCVSRVAAPPRDPELQKLEREPWGSPDHVIAEVNGERITRGDFYRRVLRRFGTAKLLAGIIKEELFLQEAKRRGLGVTPSEVQAKVNEIVDGMAREAGGTAELARIYRREGLTLAELRRDLEGEVAGQLLIGRVTAALRTVDEAALREYYQETYSRTRYRTRHTAYSFAPRPGESEGDVNRRKLEAFNKALRAADRVRKGADFVTIARAESEDSVTAAQGGDLGFIHEDSPMDPTLKKAVLELQPGDVSDPVENPAGGYHVFQVTEIVPGESYVDCEEKMRIELTEREPDLQEIEEALEILRKQSDIRVYDTAHETPPGPR